MYSRDSVAITLEAHHDRWVVTLAPGPPVVPGRPRVNTITEAFEPPVGMATPASDLMLVYTLSLVAVGVVIGAGTAQGVISFLLGFVLSLLVAGVWFGIWRYGIRS